MVIWCEECAEKFRAEGGVCLDSDYPVIKGDVCDTCGTSLLPKNMETDITAHIDTAAEAIITTRDFCGNERQSVKDYCFDNNIEFSNDFFCSAIGIADQKWSASQIAAGVIR